MRWQIDAPRESPTFGRYDPVELDTYANLLYKSGRIADALEWQERAVALSDGRDREIVANLEKMKMKNEGISASREPTEETGGR
jgi:hypothetical protein